MAKKKAGKKKTFATATAPKRKPRAPKGPRRLASHERIQHWPEPTADALPDKPLDLGPVLLPTPDRAVAVLAELADLNDRALQAHKAYLERQAAAKKAKETWEALAEQVQNLLRRATHGSGLPLFDAGEREADRAKMAPESGDGPASDAPETAATGTDDEIKF